MSSPSSAPKDSNAVSIDAYIVGKVVEWVKRHSTTYHLTVISVLGGITAVFATVIVLLIIVALNFNVLGWIE